jgi:hypothetical protein
MKRLISIFVFLFASALAFAAAEKWQASELVGYLLELDSKTAVQQFWFTERGDAMATLGAKDGPVCGPIVSWKIDADGVLRIMLDDKTEMVLKKLKVSGDRYFVEEDGVQRQFLRKEWPEYQASHAKTKK